ncbi:BatA domain-containing protein [Gillisia sp. M10.2A]|uniref:BatA domain-containing protein n=1 Tax=Gillisia lutea TaxID=2909668 RepID=A0ABS9EIX2_9FLAO|nr:BatA domain-containing protein [Gillisia lutea]MCF4101745.1 BatA domain-containing protein [Gillisia lutea]
MQFNHPEVLYALFLLIIPVIVHLFQLRKFKTEYFTNVKFLKRLSVKTRKSSTIKKWLLLTTRLLLLISIIFAFAEPYFPEKLSTGETGTQESLIYLDNSYSMQAKGKNGRFLESTIQELLESFPLDKPLNIFTNSAVYKNISRQELQKITYTPTQLDYNNVLLKANSLFSKDVSKKLLLISDFQEGFNMSSPSTPAKIDIYLKPLLPESRDNVRIDTAYITNQNAETITLKIDLDYLGAQPESIPVSIYNGSVLLGKSSAAFSGNSVTAVEFELKNDTLLNGRISIEDRGLTFDNSLFFSINNRPALNIISIQNIENSFLDRIFTEPEFNYAAMAATSIDFNKLNNAQVIILNEVSNLSNPLLNQLVKKEKENAVFIIIPSSLKMDNNFKNFLAQLEFKGYNQLIERERLITKIAFQHPVFKEVFEKTIDNFDYPKVYNSYNVDSHTIPILKYQNENPFLFEIHNNYFFTAALNAGNSNFSQSPLVVAAFYNMAYSALKPAQLYYELGKTNIIEVPLAQDSDQVLKMLSNNLDFIPRQQSFTTKTLITTQELPETAGNFQLYGGKEPLPSISYNVNRKESAMVYSNLKQLENITLVESLPQFYYSSGFHKEVDTFWKWFVTFALIFLILETLLLKYFK